MARSSYHHGDLRRALIDATRQLIEAEGPSGFSLRKVAKQAGVSPSAPAHHFGDSRGLLTAVATEGFIQLVEAFEGIDPDQAPIERLVAFGHAYLDLTLRSPGHMAVMFRSDLLDADDPAYREIAPRSFKLIESAVADAMGTSSEADLAVATKTVWSTVHGIGNLERSTARSIDDDPALHHLVDQAVRIVATGIGIAPGPLEAS
jgi:AcrR family transcriptional regulator